MVIKSLAETSPTQTIVFQWTLTTINTGVVGINFLVILMFARFRHRLLFRNHNLIIFSLNAADFLVGIGGIMTGQLYYFYAQGQIDLSVYKRGATVPYFGGFFLSLSSLAILTADRLVSVKYPFKYSSIMTRKKIIGVIISGWFLVIALFISQSVLFYAFHDDGWTELKSRAALLSIFFFGAFVTLSVSNTYLYLKICAMNNSVTSLMPSKVRPVKYGVTDRIKQPIPKSIETSKTCIWLTLLFVVCWFPVVLYYMLWLTSGKAPFSRALLTFCFSLASMNSLINPVVYIIQKKQFRHCFWNIFNRNFPTRGAVNY